MKKIALIIIGGFLGAGKTTSILGMAKMFIGQGLKVGIVTNDQGSNLVDTRFLESEGFSVLEVTGGCFCCNFDEFVEKIKSLSEHTDESQVPDVILAEPVGSCTDLIATIFRPMLINHIGRFILHPFSVVADPKRVRRVMMEKDQSLFPSEINYLFKKQMEEADVIVLNKIDTLNESEINEITEFLRTKYKTAKILTVSALDGRGLTEWADKLFSLPAGLKGIEDIDYKTYADAEAKLGWLNCVVNMNFEKGDPNQIFSELLSLIGEEIKNRGSEIAHLKLYGITEGDWFKLSLTSVYDQPMFNKPLENKVEKIQLIINARVAIDPEILEKIVENAIKDICIKWSCTSEFVQMDSFIPGIPKPKYRI